MSAEQTAAQAPQTEEQPAPGGYGSLGQLADRIWNEQGEDADGADIFEAFIEWAEGRGI